MDMKVARVNSGREGEASFAFERRSVLEVVGVVADRGQFAGPFLGGEPDRDGREEDQHLVEVLGEAGEGHDERAEAEPAGPVLHFPPEIAGLPG